MESLNGQTAYERIEERVYIYFCQEEEEEEKKNDVHVSNSIVIPTLKQRNLDLDLATNARQKHIEKQKYA